MRSSCDVCVCLRFGFPLLLVSGAVFNFQFLYNKQMGNATPPPQVWVHLIVPVPTPHSYSHHEAR